MFVFVFVPVKCLGRGVYMLYNPLSSLSSLLRSASEAKD